MPLILSSLITILLSVACYFLEQNSKFKCINPAAQQLIIGFFFGLSSIYATQFGSFEVDGAALNVRDAAPICAALLFGPWAGIISGIMGGVYRFFSAFWGIGVYTQYACSFATILSGLFTALCKVVFFKKNDSTIIHAFIITLLLQAFHVCMVPVFHVDDLPNAMMLVVSIFVPFVLINSATVIIAFLVIGVIDYKQKHGKWSQIFHLSNFFKTRDLFFTFQFWLLLIVVVCFSVNTFFISQIYERIYLEDIQNRAQLEITSLSNITKTNNNQSLEEEINTAVKLADQWNTKPASAANDDDYSFTMWYAVFDNNNNIISSDLTYQGVGDYLQDIPKNTIYQVKVVNEKSHKEDTIFAYYIQESEYKIMVCSIGKQAMFYHNITISITACLQIFIFTLLIVAIFVLLKKLVGVNIDKINHTLDQIIEGDLDQKVNVYTNKEFSQLSDSINSTVDNLKDYIEKEANRYKEDFELANQIQLSALPSTFPAFPDKNEFDLYAYYNPAKDIGGDFYDYALLDKNHLFFIIADVSGKGIPAALFMMRAKTAIRSFIFQKKNPGECFTLINRYLCNNNEADMFVTVWAGVLDLSTGLVNYVNAGHNPPLVISNGKKEYLKGKPDFILGLMSDIEYHTQEYKLKPGDLFFLYTDGITEANNCNKELFEEIRLKNSIDVSKNYSTKEVCDTVLENVKSFIEDEEQYDDITMLALKYFGNNYQVSNNNKSHDLNKKEWEYTVTSTLENYNKILSFAKEIMDKEDINKEMQFDISIVLDEIFTNIVNYGYKNEVGYVTLNIKIENDNNINKKIFQLTFIDTAEYFNPLKYTSPRINSDLLNDQEGGWGIHMTKQLVDKMNYEYSNGANVLTLKKYY